MARTTVGDEGGTKRPARLESANDNGGPNVKGVGFTRATATSSPMVHYVMERRKTRYGNDRYGAPANDPVHVELYDEYLRDEHRYVEVSGKRETVEALLLIHNPETGFASRTVYMLNNEGNIIHQFELPEDILRNGLKQYAMANHPTLRMNVTGKASQMIRDAASQAGITIPPLFADSMFRCCAQQLAAPEPRQAMGR